MVLFWFLASILTAGVVFALVRPLWTMTRSRSGQASRNTAEASDIAVYRDQLLEIDSDKSRGLLSPVEAEAARTEVARRLLTRAEELDAAAQAGAPAEATELGPQSISAGSRSDPAKLFYLVGAAVPALALALYLGFGSPWLPARPLSERLAKPAVSSVQIEELIARVEARLRSNPGDGVGWDVIAPVYLRLERFSDAAEAYGRAIELLGDSPNRLSGIAEATVLSHNGIVTEPARKAYSRLLELQPGRPEARIGLALATEQDGNLQAAADAYRSLLAESPTDAPWRGFLQERLAAITARSSAGTASAANAPPSTAGNQRPDAGDFAALSKLPTAERDAIVLRMVEGLAARLKSDGSDVAGWQKLLRSWSVLGHDTKAEAALQDARKALSKDPDGLTRINTFAKSLGLKS